MFDAELDRWLEFTCEPGETVLDAAERAGLALPYSCRSGGCLSCAARIIEGSAEMDEQYVLEEEHIARGFMLLCCTTVTSPARFLGNQEHEVEA
ncbi:MAG: ferredoxin [Deltaproteobacteria bacterium]|nr:MAG: ferredoxin [Deltaproteobacteria bacterium]